jgi:hypothetical protein
VTLAVQLVNFALALLMWMIIGRAALGVLTGGRDNAVQGLFDGVTLPLVALTRRVFPFVGETWAPLATLLAPRCAWGWSCSRTRRLAADRPCGPSLGQGPESTASVIIDEIAAHLARCRRSAAGNERAAGAARSSRSTSPRRHRDAAEAGAERVPPGRRVGGQGLLPAGEAGEVEVDYRLRRRDRLSLASSADRSGSTVAAEDTVCSLIPASPSRSCSTDVRHPRVLHADLHRDLHGQGLQRRPATSLPTAGPAVVHDPGRRAADTRAGRRPARDLDPRGRRSCRGTGQPRGPHRRERGAGRIVTDRDLRDKVAALGRDGGEPAANVMSRIAVTAEASDLCFDALVAMMRGNVHHLPVLENGRLSRVITNHDLMLLTGTSPLSVVREIDEQQDLAGLARRPDGRPDRHAARDGPAPAISPA